MRPAVLLVLILALSGCALVRAPVRVVEEVGIAVIDIATAPF